LLTKLKAFLEEANANNDLSEHEKFMQDLLVGKTTRFGATLKKTMLPNGSVDPQMYIKLDAVRRRDLRTCEGRYVGF